MQQTNDVAVGLPFAEIVVRLDAAVTGIWRCLIKVRMNRHDRMLVGDRH